MIFPAWLPTASEPVTLAALAVWWQDAIALDRNGSPTVATIVFAFASVCSLVALGMLARVFIQSIELRAIPKLVRTLEEKLADFRLRFDQHCTREETEWKHQARRVEENNDKIAGMVARHQQEVSERLDAFQAAIDKRGRR